MAHVFHRRLRARNRSALLALLTSMLVVVGVAPAALVATATAAGAAVPNPIVTGPITASCNGTCPVPPGPADGIHIPAAFAGQTLAGSLAARGYTESEYFFSGTATGFERDSTAPVWDTTGTWTARPSTTIAPAAYKSRMLVVKPTDPAKFNGTVVVEWLNVTAGFESAADFAYAHGELLRSGFAYVGVSAQAAGINGGTPAGYGLKSYDPTRYGTLVHPGDNYSYDIYSQSAQAIKNPSGINPLGADYPVQKMLAVGESQSATRMITYINAIQPLAQEFDGFFVHSRGATGAALFTGTGGTVPANHRLRTDQVPVMVFQTETDTAGSFNARQPDSVNFRQWEPAGTAHADEYSTTYGASYLATQIPSYPSPACTFQYNTSNQRYIVNSAFSQLDRWMKVGTLPNSAPLINVVSGAIQRDAYGIATGGIRLPEMDVPTKVTSGVGNTPGLFCSLFGTTKPLPVSLNSLYASHTAYVDAFTVATNAQQTAGFLLAPDAAEAIAAATNTTVGLRVPEQPTVSDVTPSNGAISVAFSPPGGVDDAYITGYAATCTDDALVAHSASGSSSPIAVSGLTNGTPYTCTVTATNAVGDGPTSAASAPATPRTTPGAPSVTGVTSGDGSVTVAFAPPASDGGATITEYTAACSDGGPSSGSQTGATTPIVVSGLTNNATYTCTVMATNAVGNGPVSAPSGPVAPHSSSSVVIMAPANTTTLETDSGTHTVDIPVSLTGVHGEVRVQWRTANGTRPGHSAVASSPAKASDDYVAASGDLAFSANEYTKNITVTVKGDKRLENHEDFSLVLSTSTPGAVVSPGIRTVTILNDDRPVLKVTAGGPVTEGATKAFSVTLSHDYYAPMSVAVSSSSATSCKSGGSCVADYLSVDGVITIPAGTTGPVVVNLVTLIDNTKEPKEIIKVRFTGSSVKNGPLNRSVTIKANAT